MSWAPFGPGSPSRATLARRAERARAKAERVGRLVAKRQHEATLASQREAEAYTRWRGGHVVPNNITMALDMARAYGPEVDQACGVEEPTVDLWEAGEVYPTWDQLRALAKLTGFGVRWFVTPFENIKPSPWWKTHMRMTDGEWADMQAAKVTVWSGQALREHRDSLA